MMMNRLLPLTLASVALAGTGFEAPRAAVAQETAPAATSMNVAKTQIEVEAQYVLISDKSLQNLGLVPNPRAGDSGPFARSDFPRLDVKDFTQFLRKTKSKVLTAPRVTAHDGEEVELQSTLQRPLLVGSLQGQNEKGEATTIFMPYADFTPELNSQLQQTLVYAGVSIGMTITPTLTGPDTMNIKASLGRQLSISQGKPPTEVSTANPAEKEKPLLDRNLDGVQILTNVKNDETVALVSDNRGLIDTLNGRTNHKPVSADSKLLVLLTARIVRKS